MNHKRSDQLADLQVRFSDSLFHAFDRFREIILLNIAEDPRFELEPWDKLTVTLIYERLEALWDSVLQPDFGYPAVINGLQPPQSSEDLSARAQWTQKISLDAGSLVDAVESAIEDGLLRNNKNVRESVSEELEGVRNTAKEYQLAAHRFAA